MYIPEASSGFRDGAQVKDITITIQNLTDKAYAMVISSKRDIQKTQQDKNDILAEIQTATDDLIKRIKQLEQVSVSLVNNKYDPIEDVLNNEIICLDQIITVVQLVTPTLSSRDKSESQIFINKKRARRHIQDLRKKLNDDRKDQVGTKLVFLKKLEIGKILDRLNKLESFVSKVKIYTAKLNGEYNIKVSVDKHDCLIVASCFLPDATVVVTDWKNGRLKRLDAASHRVTGHCDMPVRPWGVTCTAPDEVAVTLTEHKKVQFVSVRDSMSMTRSFGTNDHCRGICFSASELFVSCGGMTKKGIEELSGHVAVYTLNGAHLRTIQTDSFGQQVFHCPYHITASCDGAKIYVAHSAGGVVSSDRSGKRVCSFTDPSLIKAMGVCTLDNGHILVCGLESHNVLQFDGDGRNMTELLKYTDGIKRPTSLCYNSNTSKLIVMMKESDNTKVFFLI